MGHTQQQELSLRDYILDIEERIFNADFGDAFEDENERQLVSFFVAYLRIKPNSGAIIGPMASWSNKRTLKVMQ